MSVAEWFYAVNNQRQGPVTLEELQTKAAHQELKPTDLVWKPGFTGWTPAQKVPGIFLDKTVMGTRTPPKDAVPLESLEQTQVSPAPAAFATTQNPVTEEVAADAQADLSKTHVDAEEGKLYLTELPAAAPVNDEIESLPGDASLPPPQPARPRQRPSAPQAETSVPGFTLRWNLRGTEVSDPERSLCMSSGVNDPQLQQYLAWRRSLLLLLLLPAALSVILGMVAMTLEDETKLNLFGRLVSFLRVVPLIAIAAVTVWGTMVWWRWNLSRRVLWSGWAVATVMPVILSLFPAGWQVVGPNADLLAYGGLACFVHLLPAVWALLPGCLRAALRLKELLPEATFPGWLAGIAAVAHLLVTVALFLPLNALAGGPLLLLAGLCFLAAPLPYLWKTPVLLRPLNSEAEKTAVAMAQLLNLILTFVGFVFLALHLFTVAVLGKSLVGSAADTSWMRPWSLYIYLFPLELFTRSLLTTLVAADFFLLLNLAHWRQERALQGTPAAQTQDEFLAKVTQQTEW